MPTHASDSLGGLRRRSPNPNSPNLAPIPLTPQPYSPGLLSPYLTTNIHPSSSYSPSAGRVATRPEGSAPTIRLVGSHPDGPIESRDASDKWPLYARTRSNDIEDRPSTLVSSTANLRRHGTDPRLYPSLHRASGMNREGSDTFLRSKHDTRPAVSPPRSVPGRYADEGPVTFVRPAGSSDRASVSGSSVTGTRSWTHGFTNLRNPFRRSSTQAKGPSASERECRATSPQPSEISSRTFFSSRTAMSRASNLSCESASSASSSATLAVPFYPHTFYKEYASTDGKAMSVEMLERVRSSGAGSKVTMKFPGVLHALETGKGESWTWYKRILLVSVLIVLAYGLMTLYWSLQIMLRIAPHSDVSMVTDSDIVSFLLLFSLLTIFTALVGLTGTLLSSRPILAFYNLLLWPTLISLCLVGYTSYKRGNYLDRKLNQIWSQYLADDERLRIQNALNCCGYYNPFHDATYSKRCYPRTPLEGCKGRWTLYEAHALHVFSTLAFSIVPFHLLCIVVALLSSNHVDRQFGKGLTPLHYRLQMTDVRANALAVLSNLPIPSSASTSSLKRQSPVPKTRSSTSLTKELEEQSRRQSWYDSRRRHRSRYTFHDRPTGWDADYTYKRRRRDGEFRREADDTGKRGGSVSLSRQSTASSDSFTSMPRTLRSTSRRQRDDRNKGAGGWN